MSWIGGADGCKAGWFRALRETHTGELRFDVVSSADGLLSADPQPLVLGLDIPIGLPEAGQRECDRRARACLGWPRRSSVFPAPIRAALRANDRVEASRITEARDGRRVGAQGFALFEKIRSIDQLLLSDSEARLRIREVHPEVSFWAWRDQKAIVPSKKTGAGRAVRLGLVEGWLGEGVLAAPRLEHRKREVADDDMLDAVAALWTATRILDQTARTLPDDPPRDAVGLRMEIVY
jgi:predicted RNase H-like nuclease